MKVLGICGSPRRGGNTETLLDKALEGAKSTGAEIEKIILEELDIAPCAEKEYGVVTEEGLSVVEDDANTVFKKIAEANVLVLASPVFFGSLSAQTKMLIDRFQCVWWAKNVLKKDIFNKKIRGAFICTAAASKNEFFENAASIARNFFVTAGIEYAEELFCHALEEKDDALDRPEFLAQAFEMGKRLVKS